MNGAQELQKQKRLLTSSVADPHHFADPDPDPAFHFDADLDQGLTFHSDGDPDPTTHFFPDLNPLMLQNDSLRISPFHVDADPDPAFHSDADPDPASQNGPDPDPKCCSHHIRRSITKWIKE
jgi:hypothetical protein